MSEQLNAWADYLNQGRAHGAARYVIPAEAVELMVVKMKDDEKYIVYLQGIIEGLRRGESSK